MDIFIYTFDPLPFGRSVLEDALDEALEGIGHVTGGGAGVTGSNIDIELFSEDDRDRSISMVRDVLLRYDLPKSTVMDVDGVRYSI